jgi:uncharacterized protein (TIGR02466 family)
MLLPGMDAGLDELAGKLLARVATFGTMLLGDSLRWTIKEMWANVLQPGGHQTLHNHANSIVSGIVYLTPTAGATQTVFVRGLGGHDFKFTHQNKSTRTNRFNAERWISPDAQAGDCVLLPQFPASRGPAQPDGVRVSIAFNAIPDRLDAWGYGVSLTP